MASKTIAIVLLFNIIFFTTAKAACPNDTLLLKACANVLSGVANVALGPQSSECCTILDGIVNTDAAVCLCTAVQINALNIAILNIPAAVSLTLDFCGCPSNSQCR